MSAPEEPRPTEASGERFVPELMAGDLIEAEHQARYRMAAAHVRGRRVLDAGCGVGWGSALLVEAGAASVTGVDIDEAAVADARRRAPGATFAVGDLTALDRPDGDVDVVVCFEALEHVSDPLACLDELVRVLAPDGLLFVSSPNPDVYPAGNPFHVRELGPAELLAEVGKRLDHTVLFRQHLLVSSLLHADDADGPGALDVATRSIGPLGAGHDPYSLVVASRAPLPAVQGLGVVAPSHQLDHLETLAAALTEERATLHADHDRMVAERDERSATYDAAVEELAARGDAIDALGAQLTDADAGLRRLTADRDLAAAELTSLHEQVAELAASRADLERQVELGAAAVPAARQEAAARAERIVAERDRFGAALVQSEQALARAELELTQEVDALGAELDAMRSTVSWRLTGPLRDVRRRVPRR